MKEYTVKISKNNLRKIRIYWVNLQNIENEFSGKVHKLEEIMEKDTGINGIEFFQSDGEYVGIGNAERTMKLIQRDKLDK